MPIETEGEEQVLAVGNMDHGSQPKANREEAMRSHLQSSLLGSIYGRRVSENRSASDRVVGLDHEKRRGTLSEQERRHMGMRAKCFAEDQWWGNPQRGTLQT